MDISASKYSQPDPFEKKEVNDFIDFLFSRKNNTQKNKDISQYQKKILAVSVWNENDLKIFEENKKLFNQWPQTDW